MNFQKFPVIEHVPEVRTGSLSPLRWGDAQLLAYCRVAAGDAAGTEDAPEAITAEKGPNPASLLSARSSKHVYCYVCCTCTRRSTTVLLIEAASIVTLKS